LGVVSALNPTLDGHTPGRVKTASCRPESLVERKERLYGRCGIGVRERRGLQLFARLTRYEGASPDSIEEALETKKRVLPTEYGQTEGMKGTVFLIDREGGAIVVMSLWESAEAMSASEADAARIRADVMSAGETASVENYEVAIFAVEQTPPIG
jgi:hypothetical protein